MTPSAERWRCFVAVPLDDALRIALERAVGTWRERPDLHGLRWVPPPAWHLTLAFVGDVAPQWVATARPGLDEVAARHAPMRLPAGGVGAFPDDRAARVAWYGVGDDAGALDRLATDVAGALNIRPDRPLVPHVTLGRARGALLDLRRWLVDAHAPDGLLAVERLLLMRSHLGRGPAAYETLASIPLRATSDA